MHYKNYKYAPNDAINAYDTASFILPLVEVGLTPYYSKYFGNYGTVLQLNVVMNGAAFAT